MNPQTINLFEKPYSQARRLVESDAPVYVAINPVEYHGPHLSLNNDAIISRGLVHEMHSKLAMHHPEWPLLWGGELAIGVDPVPGPGSRPGSYRQVCEIVSQTCRSLAHMGAQRVVLMSFHGAPLHNWAIQTGVELLQRRDVRVFAPLNLLLRAMIDLSLDLAEKIVSPIADADQRLKLMSELSTDFHAGFGETSLALYYAPESVSPIYKKLPPCPRPIPNPLLVKALEWLSDGNLRLLKKELHFALAGMAWYAQRPFRGYTCRPDVANRESGAILASYIVEEYAEYAERVFAGQAQSPEPIMAWLKKLNYFGQYSSTKVISGSKKQLFHFALSDADQSLPG